MQANGAMMRQGYGEVVQCHAELLRRRSRSRWCLWLQQRLYGYDQLRWAALLPPSFFSSLLLFSVLAWLVKPPVVVGWIGEGLGH